MAEADLSIGAPDAPQLVEEAYDEHFDATDDLIDVPEVDENTVKGLLALIGSGASVLVADPDVPDQWSFTERELSDLAPPLTRIINRRPKLRQAVARGDEAAVVLVLAGYGGRNLAAGATARRAREGENGEQPRETNQSENPTDTRPAGERLIGSDWAHGGTADGVRSTAD